jgi:hypothetical protein
MKLRVKPRLCASFGCLIAAAVLVVAGPGASATAQQPDQRADGRHPHFQVARSNDSLCMKLTDATGNERALPVDPDSKLRLSFRHSIYGSRVEEVFSLLPSGFQLTELRYGEARLVEFYGHEHARQKNGTWIVTPAPRFLSSLDLRLSPDARVLLRLDRPRTRELLINPSRGVLRLTVAPCDPGANG